MFMSMWVVNLALTTLGGGVKGIQNQTALCLLWTPNLLHILYKFHQLPHLIHAQKRKKIIMFNSISKNKIKKQNNNKNFWRVLDIKVQHETGRQQPQGIIILKKNTINI